MIDQIIRNKYNVFVIFSILSILTYFKCFSVGLLSDDYGYFAGVSNDGWSSIGKNFNDPFFLPLSHIIQLIIYQLFGVNTIVFHGLQLFFHILCGWQLFLLLKEIESSKNLFFAFCCGVFFLVSPYSTETVIWLASKGYVFSLFFGLLALRYYYKDNLIPCCLCIVASIFCKEMGYVIPLVILTIDYSTHKISLFKKRFILLFSIVIGCLLIRFLTLNTIVGGYGEGIHLRADLLTVPKTLGAYLLKYCFFYRYTEHIFSSILILLFLLFISVPFIRKTISEKNYVPYVLISTLFIVTLLPVINLEITSLFSIQSDRYGYFNVVVWAIAIAAIVCSWSGLKRYILFILLAALFVTTTYSDSKKWEKASDICSNYLEELTNQVIENKNVLLINVPDNYKGVYVLRKGIDQYLSLIKQNCSINALYFQSFSSENGGIDLINNQLRCFDSKIDYSDSIALSFEEDQKKYDLMLLYNRKSMRQIDKPSLDLIVN